MHMSTNLFDLFVDTSVYVAVFLAMFVFPLDYIIKEMSKSFPYE